MPINLKCVYRSPVNDVENFINIIMKVIDTIKINSQLTVFTGDMNVNIVGIQENNNKYLNLLFECGLPLL